MAIYARKSETVKNKLNDSTILVYVELIGTGSPGTLPTSGADVDDTFICVPENAHFMPGSKLYYPETGQSYEFNGAGFYEKENTSAMRTDIDTNTANIATNAGEIATNRTNIATNAGNIATNAANIATNTTGIATNAGNIATNVAAIATNAANIATNVAATAEARAIAETAAADGPIKASLASQMVDGEDNPTYLYIGSEDGYTAGHLYYYVNGSLTDGGVYGGVNIDATLSNSGQAADAKKTGDEIAAVNEDLIANFKSIVGVNNLFNSATWTSGSISASGVIGSTSGFQYSSLIPVTAGTYTFMWTSPASTGTIRVHGYDSNGDWVQQITSFTSGSGNTDGTRTITVGSGISYVRFSLATGNTSLVLMDGEKIQAQIDTLKANMTVAQEDLIGINKFFAIYTASDYSSIVSDDYPTGWRSGYVNATTGEYNSSGSFICTADYIPVDCKFVKVTPPSGKATAIAVFDSDKNFLRIVGQANTSTYPENADVTFVANTSDAAYVKITIGKFDDAATSAADADYIAQVKFYLATCDADDATVTLAELTAQADANTEAVDAITDIVDLSTLASYTETEAANVIARVRALQTGNTLTFALVTDIHYGSTDTRYGLMGSTLPYLLDKTLANIAYVAKYIKFDYLFNLGDNTDGEVTAAETKALDDIVNKKIGLLGIPYVFTAGNHDVNVYYNSGADILSPSDQYAYLYSLMRNTVARVGSHGNDYYFDIDSLGIRVIGISSQYDYAYKFSAGADLQTWLTSVLDGGRI